MKFITIRCEAAKRAWLLNWAELKDKKNSFENFNLDFHCSSGWHCVCGILIVFHFDLARLFCWIFANFSRLHNIVAVLPCLTWDMLWFWLHCRMVFAVLFHTHMSLCCLSETYPCAVCVCARTFVCFQAAELWLTTGSSNQQCGVAATFPFPWWPPPHPSASTIEIPGSHYRLQGYRSIPFFSPLRPFSPFQILSQRLKPPVT